jgi:hypothetical protein
LLQSVYDVELEADSAASERLREVVDFGMLASEARPVDPMTCTGGTAFNLRIRYGIPCCRPRSGKER